MGYAKPQQYTSGIHIRQWSRAFIIADAQLSSRVVFVSIDACMGTQILKSEVYMILCAKGEVLVKSEWGRFSCTQV